MLIAFTQEGNICFCCKLHWLYIRNVI